MPNSSFIDSVTKPREERGLVPVPPMTETKLL